MGPKLIAMSDLQGGFRRSRPPGLAQTPSPRRTGRPNRCPNRCPNRWPTARRSGRQGPAPMMKKTLTWVTKGF